MCSPSFYRVENLRSGEVVTQVRNACLDQEVGTSSGVVSVCVYSLVILVEKAFAV